MKQRLEFNTDNTKGLDASQLETANRGYDLWYDANKFHGADFKAWRVRSELAKKRIMEMATQSDRSGETQDPPSPEDNAVQWPPALGVTGGDQVNPLTLEPLTAELPAVD